MESLLFDNEEEPVDSEKQKKKYIVEQANHNFLQVIRLTKTVNELAKENLAWQRNYHELELELDKLEQRIEEMEKKRAH